MLATTLPPLTPLPDIERVTAAVLSATETAREEHWRLGEEYLRILAGRDFD